ncbi:MAG TPA: L-fucose isomerase [Clostridiales bacterium]|nr:L-fucose isomerase [Clostridiales bacterium]
MAKSRLIGDYPVIGIRPTIDGRRGPLKVRESLEDQTMNMAKAAKKLFEDNLRYSNGEPVKVVVADTTIGRVAETAACADKFKKAGVDITLTVTPCWCYGSETMDMDPLTIKGVWGFNGTERPGAVYLAAVLASHAQKGLPAFGIYGRDVQGIDEADKIPADVKEKLLRFGRAAVAAASMRGKSYLQIGSICMGIGGSIIDPAFFEEYLGMRVESVDEVEVIRRMDEGIYDEAEYKKALEWTKKNCPEGFDKNPKDMQKSAAEKEKDWEFVVKMMCIIKDLMNGNKNLPKGREEEMVGHNAIAAGFQGQRQWTDFYPNCDYPESMLNSSFDWTGAREPYILATENDALNGVTMLFGKLLNGRAQAFADVRTYWSPEAVKKATGYTLEGKAKEAGGFIHLINSGAAAIDACGEMTDKGEHVIKPFWEVTEQDMQACLKATTWNAADLGYFRGGGFSSRFETRSEMPVTMLRINLVKGLGPVMQIAEGYTVALPQEVSDKLWARTDYTWPCTWFAPRTTGEGDFKTAYDVMNTWGANHGAFGYGHFGADVITLCSMLRIPVCMHNVPEEQIFRPAAWNAFGPDKASRDFNACRTYGPLYK